MANELAGIPYFDGRRLLAGKYDRLFKSIVSSGWANESDGNVESVTGYFALIEIPSNIGELQEMQHAVDESSLIEDEWPESGWYTCYENSDGLIFVFEWRNEAAARDWYSKQEELFGRWDLEENGSDGHGLESQFSIVVRFDTQENAQAFYDMLVHQYESESVKGLLEFTTPEETGN